MSIRKKTVVIVTLATITLVMTVFMVSRFILFKDLLYQEQLLLKQESDRMANIISSMADHLDSTCTDWSAWDDAYNFVQDGNHEFIDMNLDASTLTALDIDFMIFINIDGSIVCNLSMDMQGELIDQPPANLGEYLNSGKILVNNKNSGGALSGIINLNTGPILISCRPILNSDRNSPAAGTLIIGQYLDEKILAQLENITYSKIEISELADDSNENIRGILADNNNGMTVSIPLNAHVMEHYSVINDIFGEQRLIVKQEIPRTLYRWGIGSFWAYISAFSACAFLMTIIIIAILRKLVISRIEHFDNFFNRLTLSKNISKERISVKGTDEFANLGKAANKLLEELDSAQNELKSNEQRLRLLMEGTNDGFWDWDIPSGKLYCSSRWTEILGYAEDKRIDNIAVWMELIHPDDMQRAKSDLEKCISGETAYLNTEYRMKDGAGKWKWVLNRARVVKKTDDGNPVRMAGALSDINEQKQAERQINYLTFNDMLTGLHNRAGFEAELDKLRKTASLPLSIIMGDLNGLKIANDIFGHEEGDKLLKLVAQILKKCCRNSDFIARWGGDEYVILLYNANEETCMKICTRIRQACNEVKGLPVKPSIALGTATMTDTQTDIYEIIREAEKRMYRNKLLESKSARSAIISSIISILAQKSHETEEHTLRIQSLCVELGKAGRLPDDEIDQLALLATLHDIGKIAIPDNILLKPRKLNQEEWAIMKTHPEIGYRIAEATPELMHIAKAILHHHERFDGTGYPSGLKGDKIPVISRILAIIDAYDVMTHSRPYAAPVSNAKAVEELEKCAGTQFDPDLVKLFLSIINQE